ncbi:MAG: hypothetical protein ACI8VC_002221 [Candidatus Endobugula sp.]|jgi:hypothetical protein
MMDAITSCTKVFNSMVIFRIHLDESTGESSTGESSTGESDCLSVILRNQIHNVMVQDKTYSYVEKAKLAQNITEVN